MQSQKLKPFLDEEELTKMIISGEIKFIITAYLDNSNKLASKTFTAFHFLNKILIGKGKFTDFLFCVDVENHPVFNSQISWEEGFSDKPIRVDKKSFRVASWLGTEYVICFVDFLTKDLKLNMLSPRSHLINWIEKYAQNNLFVKCSSELEFYVLNQTNQKILSQQNSNLQASTVSKIPDYCSASISDRNEKKFNKILQNNLLNAGVEIEGHFSEYGPGQQEINIHYDEPLKSADSHVILKQCIKSTIEDIGMGCSFMAKPFSKLSGNSGHVHISVYDSKSNKSLFCSSDNQEENFVLVENVKCNKNLIYFIGGLIKYAKEVFLIFAMNVNSYRRFKQYTFAPFYLNTWGYENRLVSFRIIGKDEDLHLEVRIGGADINPYIVYSVIMASGLQGILNKIEPPNINIGNAYNMDHSSMISPPNSLKESIELFEKSEFAIKTFGKEYHECLLLLAKNEWSLYDAEVSDWEILRYLDSA